MSEGYGEGKKGGKKKLGEKSGMKKLSASGKSVGSLEARRTPSMDIPAAPSPASVSRSGLEGIDFNALNRDLAKTAASIRSLTSTSRPRKSASAELSRTSAPTSRASSAPRGPQVSMPMRAPAPRMSSMYTGRPTSAAPIRITATAPKKITPLPSASTPVRTSAPAPARTSPAPTRAATPKPAPRRSLPSPAGMSSPARKKQDEQISNLRSRVEQGRSTNFSSLGSSFYSGLSRGK